MVSDSSSVLQVQIFIYIYTYIHVDMYMKNMCVYLESRYLLQTCFVFILPGNVFPFDYYVANSLKPPPTIHLFRVF